MTYISPRAVPLRDVDIPAGPLAGLLAAARSRLVEAAARQGVTLAVSGDFDELLALNERETAAGTWFPMLPATNPRCRSLHPGNGFWLRGTDRSGDIVTVQAAVLYTCQDSSVGRRLADLTVFYDDPARAPADEWCVCNAPMAERATGRAVLTATGWTRPDHRGRRLFAIFHRVSRLVAWLRWQPESLWGVVDPDAVKAWSEAAMGPRHLDDAPTITYCQSGVGALPLRFLHFSRAQALGDLADLATAGEAAAAA
ncbi:MAG TPA: hypothetical protein VD978_08390 [Azospirillum sp.]|nr:hypothetical protein [Azospirillum sp.]